MAGHSGAVCPSTVPRVPLLFLMSMRSHLRKPTTLRPHEGYGDRTVTQGVPAEGVAAGAKAGDLGGGRRGRPAVGGEVAAGRVIECERAWEGYQIGKEEK